MRMGDYFLKSERLGFRRWAAADMELAWELFGDPAVSKFVGGPFTREAVRQTIQNHMAWQEGHGVQYWPMFTLEGGEFAGCCGLKPRPEPGAYELGFYLKPACQGKGYATEAARAVAGYAFGTLKVKELYAGHHPQNAASRGTLAKAGFVYLREELYPPTGLLHPLYRLLP